MADDDSRTDEQDEGLSTPQKVLAGAALGVAVPAAVGVARKMLGGNGDEDDEDDATSSEPTTRARRSTSKATPKAKARPKAKAKSTSKTSGARAKPKRTREQLYRQATRLKIEGRSAMSKDQLERAVERARSK